MVTENLFWKQRDVWKSLWGNGWVSVLIEFSSSRLRRKSSVSGKIRRFFLRDSDVSNISNDMNVSISIFFVASSPILRFFAALVIPPGFFKLWRHWSCPKFSIIYLRVFVPSQVKNHECPSIMKQIWYSKLSLYCSEDNSNAWNRTLAVLEELPFSCTNQSWT